jgi:hypothetical protein
MRVPFYGQEQASRCGEIESRSVDPRLSPLPQGEEVLAAHVCIKDGSNFRICDR